jgi:hypothetical protein
MVLRADLIFSNWIFAWVLIYISGLTKFSPKIAVIIAILENIGTALLLKTVNAKTLQAVILYFLLKVIAFAFVINDPIVLQDMIALTVLFLIYVAWVIINGETVIGYYKKIHQSLNNNDNNTPFVNFINNILFTRNKI